MSEPLLDNEWCRSQGDRRESAAHAPAEPCRREAERAPAHPSLGVGDSDRKDEARNVLATVKTKHALPHTLPDEVVDEGGNHPHGCAAETCNVRMWSNPKAAAGTGLRAHQGVIRSVRGGLPD